MVELRLTQPQWHQLKELLLQRRDIESKCFLLSKVIERDNDTAFVVRELVPVPREGYQQRSAGSVIVHRDFVHKLLVRCAEENLSLVEAHTHPWSSSARFSGIDLNSDPQKFKATQVMSPPFRHAALVFGGDMSFDGHVWEYGRQQLNAINRIKVVGYPLQVNYSSWEKTVPLAQAQREIFDRQIRAFGQKGQEILRDLKVGVVGLGGLGSQIVQSLALLGVGHFILVDPDQLEATNANRVVCVTSLHVEKRIHKVEAIAECLKQTGLTPSSCTPINADVTEKQAWEALLWTDVLIGAVDSALVRQFINLLSVCGLIPYLDGGVGVRTQDGRISEAGGQVKIVLPGNGYCLNSEVAKQVEEQLTPDQREWAGMHGYIQGEQIPNPQVVFLNGVIANILT
jgi:molybdopterin/thiamine biosynthesis adenylyltransferase